METAIEEFRFHDITCKSAFRKLKKHRGPYEYDMNIYRGCMHRCAYCYAIYSQRYMSEESTDFYHDIYIKQNIVEELRRQLSSSRWERKVISIGSVCDSYQPIEAERQIMRDVLKLMIEFRNPIIISTKSDLILRDLDLIKELAEVAYVNIAATITTMDEHIAAISEPGAVSPQRRAAMLKKFRKETKASIGLHDMPMLPLICDDRSSLTALMETAKDIDVMYTIHGPLNLIGDTRNAYFDMLRKHFPHLVPAYYKIFKSGRIDKDYITQVYKIVNELRSTYGISGNYMKGIHEFYQKQKVEQLSLW